MSLRGFRGGSGFVPRDASGLPKAMFSRSILAEERCSLQYDADLRPQGSDVTSRR